MATDRQEVQPVTLFDRLDSLVSRKAYESDPGPAIALVGRRSSPDVATQSRGGWSMERLPMRELKSLLSYGAVGTRSDSELLELFVSEPDEAVFEAMVRRHGPMVWGVCRRVLRDHHDAEDAFQASFLVLARKAATITPREKLGNWLYGVAYRTARKTRTATSNRRARERQVPDMPEPEAVREGCRDELLPLLDQELSRLPAKYRTPIVLCDLEGKTHRQAAEQLDWPVGTVSGRLSKGRALLGERLTRRGVAFGGGSLAMALSQGSASAGVPLTLIASATRAATQVAAGRAAAGVASSKAAALMEGALRGMLMTKLKLGATVLVVALGAAGARSFVSDPRAEAAGPAKGAEGVSETGRNDGEVAKMKGSARSEAVEAVERLGGRYAVEHEGSGQFMGLVKGLGYDERSYFDVRRISLGTVAGARPVGDAEMESLAEHLALFTRLEVLDLRGNRFTARGVAALPPLPKLKVMRLGGQTITDDIADSLERFPELTSLELEATAVSDAGVEKIRRLLPACQVSR
jgi:RNA polymerase sigma-70 factor (ECF subfamily)